MKIAKKGPSKKIVEPYYTDILKLSKKKHITLLAARKELLKKAAKKKTTV
jgi:hypothetical protein